MSDPITTKAAKCPICKGYHLIGSIKSFKEHKETRKEFTECMDVGYEILEVTTENAKSNFEMMTPECRALFDKPKNKIVQSSLF